MEDTNRLILDGLKDYLIHPESKKKASEILDFLRKQINEEITQKDVLYALKVSLTSTELSSKLKCYSPEGY